MARQAFSQTKTARTTAAPAPAKSVVITQDMIAKRAHEIWEKQGRPHGQCEAHWHQAERELRAGPKPTK